MLHKCNTWAYRPQEVLHSSLVKNAENDRLCVGPRGNSGNRNYLWPSGRFSAKYAIVCVAAAINLVHLDRNKSCTARFNVLLFTKPTTVLIFFFLGHADFRTIFHHCGHISNHFAIYFQPNNETIHLPNYGIFQGFITSFLDIQNQALCPAHGKKPTFLSTASTQASELCY